MAGIRIPLDGGRVAVIPTANDTRAVFEYENGKKTDRAVTLKGQAVFAFDAAIAVDGKGIGSARVESTTAKLPALNFGDVLYGQGPAELVVSPLDQFSVRVKLVVEDIVSQSTKPSGQSVPTTVQPSRAVA